MIAGLGHGTSGTVKFGIRAAVAALIFLFSGVESQIDFLRKRTES